MVKPPRLLLSDLAARKLKGAPPHDCGEHPDTTYQQVPLALRERVGGYEWACVECLAPLLVELEKEETERRRELKAKREAERKARRGDLDRRREEAKASDVALRAAVETVQRWEKALEARAAEREKVGRALHDAQQAEAREQKALLKARQRLAEARARVAELEARKAECPEDPEAHGLEVTGLPALRAALEGSREAWRGPTKGWKQKNQDRRTHRRAEKLLRRHEALEEAAASAVVESSDDERGRTAPADDEPDGSHPPERDGE